MKSFLSLLQWMQGDGRRAALFSALGSASVLAAAWYYEHVVKLLPCYLCYLERKPHMALIALGLPAALAKNPKARASLLAVMAVLALANTGISIFHVGVEHHWWNGLSSCSAPTAVATTLDQARNLIFGSTIVPCDKAVWFFLGISMAGWNGIISLGMALWAGFAAWRSYQSRSSSLSQ
jgi:disulfide bond formation protein DsbB